jgi:anti-anti-sigma regulatory factor
MTFSIVNFEDGAHTVLDAGTALQIRDVEADHRLLAQALEASKPLIVELKSVAAADAAGIQLLLALKQEGMRRGIPIEFRGHSAAVAHALELLGLGPDLSGCAVS